MPGLRRHIASGLLRLRRSGFKPPALLRPGAQNVLRLFLPDQPPVDPWTTTLVGGLPLGPMPGPATITGSVVTPLPHASAREAPRIKCLIVTGILDAGGSDEVVAFLARHLPRFGIATMVGHTGSVAAGSATGGRVPKMLAEEGIAIAEVAEDEAEALIARWRPDVISAHVPPPCWLEAAKRQDVPFVETLHGMHGLYGADRTTEERRGADVWGLVAVSELVRRQYLAANGAFDASRIVTIPNSVDPDRLRLPRRAAARAWLNLGEADFLFVSHSRLALQKNSYALVDAFGEFAADHPHVHLLLTGRCDDVVYGEQVRELRNRQPCRERIHLRDHVGPPGAVLAAADAFVLNGFFEGWSLASMEALCAGLPVILSDVGGAREQVGSDGRRGLVIPNPLGDPLAPDWDKIRAALYEPQANRGDLLAAFVGIYEDRSIWAERRDALRAESLQRFHPDRSLSAHARLLLQAAEKPARGTAFSQQRTLEREAASLPGGD